MLSYPIDEAETLLTSKLATAKQSYENCEEDLDFLREQITASLIRILSLPPFPFLKKTFSSDFLPAVPAVCYDHAASRRIDGQTDVFLDAEANLNPLTFPSDHGSRYCEGLQLGCRTEAEREGRGGEQRGEGGKGGQRSAQRIRRKGGCHYTPETRRNSDYILIQFFLIGNETPSTNPGKFVASSSRCSI